MDKSPSAKQIAQLSQGVNISTSSLIKYDKSPNRNKKKERFVKTLPCRVLPVSSLKNTFYLRGIEPNSRMVQITLIEGKNQQIRKMAEAVGLSVVALHRVSFAGITLKRLTRGSSLELNEREMLIIRRAVKEKMS
jgi:pseudouridine synthase